MARILLIFMGWLAMRGQLLDLLGLATGAVNPETVANAQQKTSTETKQTEPQSFVT